MRAALLSRGTPHNQASRVVTIPAPSGGMNTRDSQVSMAPTDAVELINAIARQGEVEIREGAANWTTGFPTGKTIETLMPYNPASGSGKLFASTDAAIYNATAAGAVGSAESPTVTNGRWQWVNFANSANTYLIAVNGTNSMISYNGSTWTTTAALGSVTTSTLVDITVYQKRLFFLQKDSRQIHYLAAGAISGTASTLAFEQLMKLGGKIQAIGTWTVDAGDGLDDLFVAVTSEGEAIVYSGIDPGVAADWVLKGVYFVGKPIGQRCFFKLAGELVVITDRGLYPMSRALSEGATKREAYLSDKINKEFIGLAKDYSTSFGWQAVTSTADNVVLVNVPGRSKVQLVMDLSTFGWSYFTGFDASCWAYFNGDLYYGTTEKTVKALTGEQDFGNQILAFISPAFLSFGSLGQQKHIKALRPIFIADSVFTYYIGVNADFDLDPVLNKIAASSTYAIALWDTAVWDEAVWGGSLLQKNWQFAPSQPGILVAGRLKIIKNGAAIRLQSIDYMVQTGGVL